MAAPAAAPQTNGVDTQRVHTDPVYWHSTIMPNSSVSTIAQGSFSMFGALELVVVRHTSIDLCVLSKKNVLERISSTPMFATVRSVAAVPMASVTAETTTDLLAVTSDSGDITLLRFKKRDGFAPDTPTLTTGGTWVVESSLPFAKAGIRTNTAGHFVAADAEGRCVFVVGLLRQKLLFPIRQEHATLAVQSPIEAHRNSAVFDVVTINVEPGTSPVFAVLEHPYDPASDGSTIVQGPPYTDGPHADGTCGVKQVLYYQYDVGTNNVLRTWSFQVPSSAHKLIAAPTGAGNGGVLICAKGEVWWADPKLGATYALLPRREAMPLAAGELIITAAATVTTKKTYFILLQTQLGDLYRVQVGEDPATGLPLLRCRYFDTVPVARQLVLTRRGMLLVATEHGPHLLFSIVKEGYADDSYITKVLEVTAPNASPRRIPCFPLHPVVQHLRQINAFYNSGGMVRTIPQMTKQGIIEFHSLCGTGRQSAVLTSRSGFAAPIELVCPLAAACERVWVLAADDGSNRSLVLSMADRTSVLAFHNDNTAVVPDTNTQFRLDVPTLFTSMLKDGAGILQVHREGLRHIGPDKSVTDWKNELRKEVVAASCNGRQLLVGFARGGVTLFQLDLTTRKLLQQAQDATMADAVSVTVPSAQSKAANQLVPFVGITVASNEFYVLDAKSLRKTSKQPITYRTKITSCLMLYMSDGVLYAFVGMSDGIVIRVAVDSFSGELKAISTLHCGTAPCRVVPGDAGSMSCYVISSQLWRCTSPALEGLTATPVICGSVVAAGANASAAMAGSDLAAINAIDGSMQVVHLVGSTLFVLNIDTSSGFFQERTPLRCTGRQFLRIGQGPHRELYVVGMCEKKGPIAKQHPIGVPHTPLDAVTHTSYVQLYSPATRTLGRLIDLPPNDAITSMAVVRFAGFGADPVLVVGVANEFKSNPPTCKSGSLIVFRIHRAAEPAPGAPPPPFPVDLSPVSVTWVRGMPTALAEFKGRLLVGMDGAVGLHMMKWGQKRLLRHVTLPNFPSRIVSLEAQGDLILCGTAEQSVVLVRYHGFDKVDSAAPLPGMHACLLFVGRDPVPRYLTATCFVDDRTIAVADRFGNLAILRIPSTMPTDVADELLVDDQLLEFRSRQALQCVATTFIGQVVTSLAMTAGNDVPEAVSTAAMKEGDKLVPVRLLVYSTILGRIGCIQPFVCDEDVISAHYIHNHLLSKMRSLCGRRVVSYLSTYAPMRNVIEGDILALLDRPEGAQLFGPDQPAQVAKIVDEQLNRGLQARAQKLLKEDIRQMPSASQLLQKMKSMVPLL